MSGINETAPRYRLNMSQNSKNQWTLDATGEDKDIHVHISTNPEDIGDVPAKEPLGLKVLSMIKEAEEVLREDGRLLISDPNLAVLTSPKSYSPAKKEAWYEEKIKQHGDIVNALVSNYSAELGKIRKS